ncbi:MAG TPA: thiamine-phosphate kinase [Cyclobacteriaceae bacterium]|nr:thiamine-phosphate kinase [Cyclobacteriaceae bacterium]
MSEKRSEVSQFGEFGLIKRISSHVTLQNKSSLVGIGDDAAVISADDKHVILLSTDMLVEGIHFDLAYTPIRHLGYKSVAVNVSDIAAMNGQPEQITVSIAISNRFSVEAIDELYAGIHAACENYKVDLVGGDTTSSVSGLIISISILGKAAPEKVAYRSGAKINDIICVTGDLGAAYLGLQVLEREKQAFLADAELQPDLEKYEYLIGRILKPEARTDIVYELEELNVKPTAMIDVSDGLASDVLHISETSGAGVRIMEDRIPIDTSTYETAIEFNLDPITCALNGGEDYELLFTVAQSDFEKIKNHPDIHTIGFIHADKNQNIMISKQQTVVPLRAQGWDHFRK